eukprot:116208-Pelagomonas_calceolata.AAC.2
MLCAMPLKPKSSCTRPHTALKGGNTSAKGFDEPGTSALAQLTGRDAPSNLIAFAQKTLKDGAIVSKLHVIELGGAPGERTLMLPWKSGSSHQAEQCPL